ncbi:MAG: hypothetical protein LBF64_00980 [Oscillospiraceae bacterium]|jgi:uncharacterized protein YukE|nr:hypothetical protein [Oscillospiraceae bacterium]
MPADIVLAAAQVKAVGEQADAIRALKEGLTAYSSKLNAAWVSSEMKTINHIIEDLRRQLDNLAVQLDVLQANMQNGVSQLAERDILW